MNTTELDQHYRRYLECLNQRQVGQLDQFVHETIQYNGAPMSRDDWKAGPILATVEAMPDFRWTISEILVEGERIAVQLTDTGTLAREWMGLPPMGRSVQATQFPPRLLWRGSRGWSWSG